MKIRGRYLVVVIAMCGLAAATVGLTTNVAGLFFTPMAEEFGVMQGTASLTLTISNICVALGGLATRRLTKLVPLRVLLTAGVAILAGSALGTAWASSISVAYILAATRGISGGIIGFVLITYVLNKWFVAQLGLATSVAMGFSGLAGALFTPLIQPVVSNMGWLIDRIGAKNSIFTFTAIVSASIVALFFVHVPVAFFAAALAFGLCYARATAGVTMMCREIFGKRGFGIVYPIAALGTSFANAIFSAGVGFGYDLTGGYAVSLFTFLAFLVGSFFLVQWCYVTTEAH